MVHSVVPPEVETPEILVDRDVLGKNVTRMAEAMRSRGLRLRPHAKTHKMAEVARLQLAAGACGLTVATVGEAEHFAAQGVEDLFIAYPLWTTPARGRRLRELSATARLTIGTDSADGARALAAHLREAARRIEVLVELDSGHHRSGVAPQGAVDVARAAAQAGLQVTGVFSFPGHSYAPGRPAEAAAQEHQTLVEAAELLTAAGFAVTRLSGGSTPSALLTEDGGVTEVRPGVYVFGDAQQLELGRCGWEDIALTVAATVVSRHETGADGVPRRIILDAGSKVLGGDRPAWTTGHGRIMGHPQARITALSEHHATVAWPEGQQLPALGERVSVIPNHVCMAVNLVDEVTVVRGGEVVDRWTVGARGLNR
ncbi:D-TA family PLP-dependent enzyme [Nesterenkonia suensis]